MKRFALVIAAIGFAGQASAASIDPLAFLQSYNAIALGDFTMQSSHVEGTVFVGGDLHTNNDTDVNGDAQVPTVLGAALVVGGDVTGGAVKVLSGDADIGGSANGLVAMNGGGTLTEGLGASIPVADVIDAMLNLSTELAGMTPTGVVYDSGDQNAPLTLGTADANGYAVLNLTEVQGQQFLAGNINTFDSTGYNGVFINVAGTGAFSHTGNWNVSARNVIINLYEATSFSNDNGNVNFSVLAPLADAYNGGSGMSGFLVASSITNNAEIRPPYTTDSVNYTGTLPPLSETTATVPLPAAGLLLLGALGGLGFARRRRAA